MAFNSSSLAAGVGAGVQNVPRGVSGSDVPRNIVIVGTYLSSISGITNETIYGPYTGATAIGAVFGFGSMIHRLALSAFQSNTGATVWVVPQAETVGSAAATSASVVVTGPSTAAGTLAVYIDVLGSYGRYAISVASGDSATTIGDALAAAINADSSSPVTAVDTTGSVALTAKSKGPWGNSIPVAVNIVHGDALPAGVGVTVTALTGGTGVPVIANALNALGTGSNANNLPNNQWMTDLVHGYLGSSTAMATTAQDQTTLTAISTYNGLAGTNPPTGCYSHIVGRPFRCINGDNTNSATVPSALVTLATTNNEDRTDGLLCLGGSRTHPCEIAAVASGVVESVTAQVAAKTYVNQILIGVEPGPGAQWNQDYDNRDTAVKAGLSPALVVGGYAVLQNVVTFYTSNTSVPSVSNGYREFVNLAKIQNIIADTISTFKNSKWSGCTIVQDSAVVTDPDARQIVRSVDDVIDELIARVKYWASKAWLYNTAETIAALQVPGAVTVRPAGDGFTNVIPTVFSGMANIIDTTIQFDISVAGL